MRFIKYIFILNYLLPTVIFSLDSTDLCSSSFSNHREFIRVFFSDPKNINLYERQKGYIEFVEEYLNSLQMDTVFNYASSSLSKDNMETLNWQKYQGTTKEFQEERSRILDEKGNVKKEYQSLEGYVRYADEFYGGERKEFGDMFKAYTNVSAVLNELEKKSLNWQEYQGTTKEFREERSRILDEKGNVKKEYQGMKGYVRYSDRFYRGEKKEFGDMFKAYTNVSAVLSESEKKNLNWKKYQGTTKEFQEERSRVLDEKGNVKKEYQGLKGYTRYANKFYNGAMLKSYINVSAVLSRSERKNLNWQAYQGMTKEFQEERSQILDEKGKVKGEYQGVEGYARYADEFYGGEKKEFGGMQKTYQNVSAVLSKEEMKNLGWKMFFGDTRQIRALFEFFKNHSFEDYKGVEGQKEIARMIFKDHLVHTYRNVSTLRDYLFNDKDEFKNLRKSGWSQTLSW